MLDGRALTAIPRADRLDELAFEVPLAGGETPSGHVTLGRLAAELQEHIAPDDPLRRPYANVLATPGLGGAFRGYLTGTIDVVCRDCRAVTGGILGAVASRPAGRSMMVTSVPQRRSIATPSCGFRLALGGSTLGAAATECC